MHARIAGFDDLVEVLTARRLPPPKRRRRIRVRAGASLREVASALGVTQAAVSRWERGLRAPAGEMRAAYAELLARLDDLTTPQASPRTRHSAGSRCHRQSLDPEECDERQR